MCNSDGARRKRGHGTRDAVQDSNYGEKKIQKGRRGVWEIKMSRPQTTETDGSRGLWTRLGKKKKQGGKQRIPRQPDGMMP